MFIIFLPNDAVQADDIQNETNELLRIRDYLFKELAQKTGQPVEKVEYGILPLSFPLSYVMDKDVCVD